MHIPDAYLSPVTQLSAAILVAPLLMVAVRKTRCTLTTKQVPLVSVGAAFCFAIQMFNIPALGGTTAHALGTVLLAILLGPWAAMITMTLTLAVQALFFGDGGVLSLAVNAFDMAVVPAFVGHGVYRLLSGDAKHRLVASAVASYVGTSVAALSAGLILGLQPLLAHDSSGHALYFPFGWAVSVPAMVYTHLLIAAPAEAIITVFALAYLWRNFPELARVGTPFRLGRAVGFVLLLTPIGLLAGGGAWGEWDADTLKRLAGYVPSGVAQAREVVHPMLPDYGLPNAQGHLWEIAGYILSALIGAGLVAVVTRSLVSRGVSERSPAEERLAPGSSLPSWLTAKGDRNVPATSSARPASQRHWIEALLRKMRSTIEETVAMERVARMPGLLQGVSAPAKAVLALGALFGIALAGRQEILIASLFLTCALAAASKVPFPAFLGRLAASVAFFGSVVAAPVALAAVTPGRAVFGSGAFALSDSGLHMASLILLRIACGIGVTLIWTLTTRWNDLVGSLRLLGLPAFFCTGITLAYRYLFVTIETLEEMAEARRSRQAGPIDKGQARSYSGAGAAILFSKSHAFTEELHLAMRSRTLETEGLPMLRKRRRRARLAYMTSCIALILTAILLKVAHIV